MHYVITAGSKAAEDQWWSHWNNAYDDHTQSLAPSRVEAFDRRYRG